MNSQLDAIEIHPKIIVYKNIFKDIEKNYEILKRSFKYNGENFLGKWQTWSQFGDYVSNLLSDQYTDKLIELVPFQEHKKLYDSANIEKLNCKNEIEQDEKNLILELINGFHKVTKDYAYRHNINLDPNENIKDRDNQEINLWQVQGPGIARYKDDIINSNKIQNSNLAMVYHTDYIREPINSPGYKFVITALAYFNDDYEGGEIDFYTGNDLYKYKPEAGDYLVFPSGHPEILNFENSVLLHGVLPAYGSNKYLSRMYWQKYSIGSEEWYEKEKEFGKETWSGMQPDLMEKFRISNPIKNYFMEGNRIQ